MKVKSRMVAVLLTVLVLGAMSSAQAEVKKGEILFGPSGLFNLPTDDYPSPKLDDIPLIDFGGDMEPSPGLGGGVDRMITPKLSLGGEFKIYFGSIDEQKMQDFIDAHVAALDEAEYTWRTVQFGARVRYFMQPEKRFNPFLQAGVGLYVNKLKAEFRQIRGSGSANSFPRSDSYTNPGISIGPGALFRISKDVRLSMDAIFSNVFSDERNIRYIGASMGLVFSVTPQ